MRLTKHKREILDVFRDAESGLLKSEIGMPPLDVRGISYMLHGMNGSKKSKLENVRRTLDAMVADGLLDKAKLYDRRQNRMQGWSDAPGVVCLVSMYSLKGHMPKVTEYRPHKMDSYIDCEFSVVENKDSSVLTE